MAQIIIPQASQVIDTDFAQSAPTSSFTRPRLNDDMGQFGLRQQEPFTQTQHRTQKDQDNVDEAARRKALKELLQSWMDRLQLISVLTTFFAAMEAQLLGNTSPTGTGPVSVTAQVANIGLICALIVHSFAAMISFLAAFALIRFKLTEATKKELRAESFSVASPNSVKLEPATSDQNLPLVDLPLPQPDYRQEIHAFHPQPIDRSSSIPEHTRVFIPPPRVFSTNPHIESFNSFHTRKPPMALLEHAYALSISMAAVGFVLVVVGIVCWAWSQLPGSVAIASTAAVGICTVAGAAILI